jgi:hypothetical protein
MDDAQPSSPAALPPPRPDSDGMVPVTESSSADDARATAQRLVEHGIGATVAVVERHGIPGVEAAAEGPTTVHVVSCLATDAHRARLLLGLSEPDEIRAAATRAEVDGEDFEAPKQKAPVKTLVLLGLGLSVVVVVAAFTISYYLASR